MRSRRQQYQTYQEYLLHVVDQYLNSIKDKWFRNTGRARAAELKLRVEFLSKTEGLSDEQLIACMMDYTNMQHGTGMFGSSNELRRAVVKSMWQYLEIDPQEVSNKASEFYEPTLSAMTYASMSPSGGGEALGMALAYPYEAAECDAGKYVVSAKLVALATERLGNDRPQASPLLQALEDTIKAYQDSLKSTWCWGGIKLGRQTGYDRATALLKHIKFDLFLRDNLTDDQIAWRLCEYMREPNGDGRLGTSKELRAGLSRCLSMHMFGDNQDKRNVIDGEIRDAQVEQFLLLGASSVADPSIDISRIAINTRIKHIHAELRDRRREELQVSNNNNNKA
jgi:hypothetical protein